MPAFSNTRGGTLTDAQVKVLASGIKPRWSRPTLAKNLLPAYENPKEDASAAAEAATRGAKLFTQACGKCHGDQGEGTAKGAGPINDRDFLDLISDQALRRIIITGRPDLGMPDFNEKMGRDKSLKPLTSAEISDLVALLASWRRGGAMPGKAVADEKKDDSKPPQSD
jgi:mono/diheme cytochrome c family protein